MTKLNDNPKVLTLNNNMNPKAIFLECKNCDMVPLDVDQLVITVIST
jgi:hypothetical protein